MSGSSGFAIVNGGEWSARRVRILRVEKARDSSALHGERRDSPDDDGHSRAGAQASRVSRSDTHDAAPLWHGPALRAAFVAQLLGQVMPQQQQASSGLAGYEPRRQRVLSLGLDAEA